MLLNSMVYLLFYLLGGWGGNKAPKRKGAIVKQRSDGGVNVMTSSQNSFAFHVVPI